jgi:CRP-like cAMP-binding protein
MHEIAFVRDCFRNIEFFKRLSEELPEHIFLKLFKTMLYEECEANDVVFHYGDFGSKFYVLLQGEAVILTPKSQEEIERENEEKLR